MWDRANGKEGFILFLLIWDCPRFVTLALVVFELLRNSWMLRRLSGKTTKMEEEKKRSRIMNLELKQFTEQVS